MMCMLCNYIKKAIMGKIICTFLYLACFVAPVHAQFSGGQGTPSSPYQITTAEQLRAIGNHLSQHFLLLNDIDLGDQVWTPLGSQQNPFTGRLNGNGRTIHNLKIRAAENEYGSMFRNVSNGGVIEYIAFSNVDVRGMGNLSTVAGVVDRGTLRDIQIDGRIESEGYGSIGGMSNLIRENSLIERIRLTMDIKSSGSMECGGMISSNMGVVRNVISNSNLENCYSGIVGYNSGVVDSVIYNGSIRGQDASGVVAMNYGEVKRAKSTGYIQGSRVGGIVLQNWGIVDKSYSNMEIQGSYVGGIVNSNGDHSSYSENTRVTESIFEGSIYAAISGGIVLENFAKVENNVSIGFVKSYAMIAGWERACSGGIVGCSYNAISLNYNLFIGKSIGVNVASPIMGEYFRQYYNSNNNVWDFELNELYFGNTWSQYGIGATRQQLIDQNFYDNLNWDFSNIWYMSDLGFPLLLNNPFSNEIQLENNNIFSYGVILGESSYIINENRIGEFGVTDRVDVSKKNSISNDYFEWLGYEIFLTDINNEMIKDDIRHNINSFIDPWSVRIVTKQSPLSVLFSRNTFSNKTISVFHNNEWHKSKRSDILINENRLNQSSDVHIYLHENEEDGLFISTFRADNNISEIQFRSIFDIENKSNNIINVLNYSIIVHRGSECSLYPLSDQERLISPSETYTIGIGRNGVFIRDVDFHLPEVEIGTGTVFGIVRNDESAPHCIHTPGSPLLSDYIALGDERYAESPNFIASIPAGHAVVRTHENETVQTEFVNVVEEWRASGQFRMNMVVTSSTDTLSVMLGVSEGATEGFDPLHDQYAPPSPPSGIFDVRFTHLNEGYYRDVRALGQDSLNWQLDVQNQSGVNSVSLSWNSNQFPEKGLFTLHYIEDGVGKVVDMRRVNSLNINNFVSGSLYVKYKKGIYVDVEYERGWALVGLPVAEQGQIFSNLFVSMIPNTTFGYRNAYMLRDTLLNGEGYWLRLGSQESVRYNGQPIDELVLNLRKGWNLISGGTTESTIMDENQILVPNTLYGFNRSYVLSSTLYPGRGYWVGAHTAGQIRIVESQSNVLPQLRNLARNIEFRNSHGELLSGLLLGTAYSNLGIFGCDLPPVPPVSSFDVRFQSQSWCHYDHSGYISMQQGEDVVTISNTGNDLLNITQFNNSTEIGKFSLLPSRSMQIQRNINTLFVQLGGVGDEVIEFRALNVYPIPAGDVITIQMTVPDEEMVQIRIFNVLGQEVLSSQSDLRHRGLRQDTVNLVNLPNGIYFLRLEHGENVQTMSIVKK